MEHILDYDILQEWGFVSALTSDFGNGPVVTSYYKENTYGTDAHLYRSITLTMFPHDNFNVQWIMHSLDAKSPLDNVPRGTIENKTTLECILNSCIVFKPDTTKVGL